MTYEDKKNTGGETETLSSEDQNVARLLSNLNRVDVPKDFDFHLKARIANGSPVEVQPFRFFPILKYAMPLALFLLVGTAFVVNSSYSGWNVPVVAEMPYVATQSATQPAGAIISPRPLTAESDRPTGPPDNFLAAENLQSIKQRFPVEQPGGTKSPRSQRPVVRGLRGGGSYDSAGNNAPAPILSLGFGNSNSNSIRNPGGFDAPRPLEFRQMLRSLGIEADFEQSGWRVRSVTKNGVAERSGLKSGDLMEAIDNKPISTLYDGSFSVKSISVRRSDQVVNIDIRNK